MFGEADSGKGSIETRWVRKDGMIIDIQLSSVPINPSDLSVGVTFTALEITEKKQFQKDLIIRSEFERLITGISTRFINLPAKKLEKTLISALSEICEFTEMDRGCILTFSDDHSFLNQLCMFTRKNAPYSGYKMPSLVTEKIQWWLNLKLARD